MLSSGLTVYKRTGWYLKEEIPGFGGDVLGLPVCVTDETIVLPG